MGRSAYEGYSSGRTNSLVALDEVPQHPYTALQVELDLLPKLQASGIDVDLARLLLIVERMGLLDRRGESAVPNGDGWPEAHSLVEQVRDALGMRTGAQASSPAVVWAETLEYARLAAMFAKSHFANLGATK